MRRGRICVSKRDISGDKSPAPRGNDLAVPFLFVPKGKTPPEDWLWAHPGAIRIPATVTLRRDGTLAGIEIAQNEGDTIAAPSTARGFAPVPGQTEPETPASPFLSDVVRQFLIASGLENFPRAEPPAEGPLSAVPLMDDQGNPVMAPSHRVTKSQKENLEKKGEEPEEIAVMRPQFMDPHFFVRKGIEDRKEDEEKIEQVIKNLQMGMEPAETAPAYFDLFNFDHGGPWDAQRIAGRFYDEYVEYATIAIGLYAAAYGIPEEEVLEMENFVAGKFNKDREFSKIYTNLPEDNVKWTDIGYELYKYGKISSNNKP